MSIEFSNFRKFNETEKLTNLSTFHKLFKDWQPEILIKTILEELPENKIIKKTDELEIKFI